MKKIKVKIKKFENREIFKKKKERMRIFSFLIF